MIIGNPTGGVVYHWRALKYKNTLWVPFRANLNAVLNETKQYDSTLLWIGPSAGYNVTDDFLKRYKHIVAVEIDPLARVALRLRQLPITFVKRDLFAFAKADFQLTDFQDLLLQFPQADILFANLLGQIALISDETMRLTKLKASLQNRNWITFHDRLSARYSHCENKIVRGLRSNEELVLEYFKPEQAIQVQDHGTLLLDHSATAYLHWEIRPGYHHIVGCTQFLA